MNNGKKKAVFLDKDGTLVRDVPFNVDPALIELEAEIVEGLQLLQQEQYLLVVISNQSGVARGMFGPDALQGVKSKLEEILGLHGIGLQGFYFCPHYPEGTVPEFAIDCNCRKPMPGLLLKAATDLGIDLSSSWMVGDILNDVEAGNLAGCKTVLVDNGNETEWLAGENRTPDFTAETINEAASYIVNQTIVPPCVIA